MMRLDLPAVDHDQLFDTLVDERQNGVNAAFFEGIREAWKARTRLYVDKSGNPELIAPWELVGERATSFKTLYRSPMADAVQKPILEALRSRKLQLCPFCGESGAPQTLDHFLPLQRFPEFAVMPANLAPMCDACQGAKGTKTVDEDLQRFFLHPYFDTLANEQLVVLTIKPPFVGGTGFELLPVPVLEPLWHALVDRHLRELEIKMRFNNYFDDQYIRMLRQAQDIRAEGGEVAYMVKLFASINRRRSRNCWDYVFYAGVLANEELLEFLQFGDLPEML